ncbi:MAG: UDP-3-O-(3-hydroxymyristoyl)glucosamine N-acyltransferase [Flavobacteriales bacterium]|nr:UDP-3-O-(3-hydroxymyristoyl)glucosamine N-acyltransferase [Flavobacteriales bacterium]
MRIPSPPTVQFIADKVGGEVIGDPNALITGINEIHRVEEGDIIFVDHSKYYKAATSSKATTILIDQETECPEGKNLIIVDSPFSAFNHIINLYYKSNTSLESISPTASIGVSTIIMANVVIEDGAIIGDNCVIHPNVTIGAHCIIKNNVIIHANTVLGADGFYYKKTKEGYNKLISCGNVVIEDDVEIGALCSIDRGVSASTIIGSGSKLDNQVHVGHDTVIGKNCLFAAQVGIAGVVTIEDNVTLWGQVGVASDLTIGEGVVILAQSAVRNSLEPNKTYLGTPVSEAREKMKEMAMLKKLPSLMQKINTSKI